MQQQKFGAKNNEGYAEIKVADKFMTLSKSKKIAIAEMANKLIGY